MKMKQVHINKHDCFALISHFIKLHVDDDFVKGLCCVQKLRYWPTVKCFIRCSLVTKEFLSFKLLRKVHLKFLLLKISIHYRTNINTKNSVYIYLYETLLCQNIQGKHLPEYLRHVISPRIT